MQELYRDVVDTFYWVALPLTTVNGVSQYQPEWGGLAWNGAQATGRCHYGYCIFSFLPLRNMRVCEPFGPEQRRGLWLYHILEPDTWARMCSRVSGAASRALYANESGAYFDLRKRISKPEHHTRRSYAVFLLNVMPEKTAEHYRNKIAVYLRWYQTHGYPDDIPDEQENNTGGSDIPSW